MSENDSVSVSLPAELRKKLRELRPHYFDNSEISYVELIEALADEKLSALEEEEAQIAAKRESMRAAILEGGSPSDDEDALSDESDAREKQRELQDGFGD